MAAGGGGGDSRRAGASAVIVPVMPTPKVCDTEKHPLLLHTDGGDGGGGGGGGSSGSGSRWSNTLGRLRTVLRSFKPQHVRDFGQMMDPLALLFLFLFSVVTGCLGIWQLVNSNASGSGNVAVSFVLGSPISGSPFLVIATLWAFYNAVAPYCESNSAIIPQLFTIAVNQ